MTAAEYNKAVLQGILNGKPATEAIKTANKGKSSSVPSMNETQIQKQCIEWFRRQYRSVWDAGLLIHIANERHCSVRRGKELKDMGVRRGVPDLQLFVARKGYHGLLIEMKKPHEYPRPEQRELMNHLAAEGYLCVVCKSLDEFRNTINNYLV